MKKNDRGRDVGLFTLTSKTIKSLPVTDELQISRYIPN